MCGSSFSPAYVRYVRYRQVLQYTPIPSLALVLYNMYAYTVYLSKKLIARKLIFGPGNSCPYCLPSYSCLQSYIAISSLSQNEDICIRVQENIIRPQLALQLRNGYLLVYTSLIKKEEEIERRLPNGQTVEAYGMIISVGLFQDCSTRHKLYTVQSVYY